MPIYEYVCNKCMAEFEVLTQSMSNVKDPTCPTCESTQVQRKLSVFATHQGPSKPSCYSPDRCGQCCDPHGPCSI